MNTPAAETPKEAPTDYGEMPENPMFLALFDQSPAAMCLLDPHRTGNPVLRVNDAFTELTGYSAADIRGRELSVLGGSGDAETLARLYRAIGTGEAASGDVTTTRKDGSTFHNRLLISPLHNKAGELALFVVTGRDVAEYHRGNQGRVIARELSHRMKNMFAIIGGIISITGRLRGIEQQAEEINARIYALGRAFETTLDDADTDAIDVGQAIDAILKPYNAGSPRLTIVGEAPRVSFATISLLGLVLHELADNARRHGAWADESGSIHLNLRTDAAGEQLVLDWQEKTARPPARPRGPDGTGNLIINRILSRGVGSIDRRWSASGLQATLQIAIRRN